jgi:hypothetical protein
LFSLTLTIEVGVRFITEGLEGLNDALLHGGVLQLRKAAPTLTELQQGLTSLVEALAAGGVPSVLENSELVENENEGIAPAKRSCWRTEQIGASGGIKHVYIGL